MRLQGSKHGFFASDGGFTLPFSVWRHFASERVSACLFFQLLEPGTPLSFGGCALSSFYTRKLEEAEKRVHPHSISGKVCFTPRLTLILQMASRPVEQSRRSPPNSLHMKNTLFALFAALALVGCSDEKRAVDNNAEAQKEALDRRQEAVDDAAGAAKKQAEIDAKVEKANIEAQKESEKAQLEADKKKVDAQAEADKATIDATKP